MTSLHTEMYPVLAEIITEIDATDSELARSLAHFAVQVSPKLDHEERALLAKILRQAVDLKVPASDTDPAKHVTRAVGTDAEPSTRPAPGKADPAKHVTHETGDGTDHDESTPDGPGPAEESTPADHSQPAPTATSHSALRSI